MAIKLISVLHGSSNSGKSSTLRELCNFLLREGGIVQIEKDNKQIFQGNNFKAHTRGDFAVVIQIKIGNKIVIVGVGTGGDSKKILKENFDFFEKHHCDIAFCATKSVNTKSDGSSINYFYNTYLLNNKTAVVLPFFKFKADDKKSFNEQLAQRMLLITKLQWNNLDKNNSQIGFN